MIDTVSNRIAAGLVVALLQPLAATAGAEAPEPTAADWTRRALASPLVEPAIDVSEQSLRLDYSASIDLGVSMAMYADAPGAAGGDQSQELAKKLQNPVADLISVPFQFNYDEGYGPKDAGRLTVNIQPVIPFSISEDWNLITRTIVPVIYAGSPADGVDSAFGLGDTLQSFFLSPKKPIGGWILGAGPAIQWPTGTTPLLRSEQFGLGPTIVALRQEHGWTYGALFNHIWGISNESDHPDVNRTFLQPFLSYTWPTATTLTFNTESSYDWTAEEWTVPLNLMISQMLKLGDQIVQFQLGGRYYPESPSGGPEWGIRFAVTLVFPK